jgi:predicted phosphodiesterase
MQRKQNREYNCPCLDIAGQLNYTREGIPIEDCQTCHGTGFIPNKPNLILCSDLHLREDTPTCYIGDFQKEQWDSLDFIRELQKEYDCPVLCAGDMFHHWKPSPFLLSQTIEHLPDDFWVVYGQHDLPNHNLELSCKSGIFTLNRAGKLRILPQGHWGKNDAIHGNWTINGKNIYVWHITTYQNNLPWPGCTASSAKQLLKKYFNCDLFLTGDNHQPFIEEYEGRLLVNPGSMTRQDADQLNHRPRVYLWYAKTNTVEPVYLPIVPGNDVISREHIEVVKQRNERLDAFIAQLNFLGIEKPKGSEGGATFEENLKMFENTNQVRSTVMQIVYKAMEEV